MTQVSDNFARADGGLGSNWAAVIPNHAEFDGNTNVGGGIAIRSQGYGPINASGGDACALWNGGQTFGNDQFAMATVKTVASPTAVLSITAATQSGGNTTYTYTVTSGSVASPISGGFLYVIVAGMQNAGNNGHFIASTFGSGTFTVANASGVTESGSSGTGTCPSDSGAGVVVRGSGTSVSTLTGYFFHVGSNSFNGNLDGRSGYSELWKIVNGVGTLLYGPEPLPPPTIGDVIEVIVIGSTITIFKNGSVITTVVDSSIASGVPGIWTFSVNGPNEYNLALWNTNGSFTGNNGTTLNNWVAGDIFLADTQLASDPLTEGITPTQLLSDSMTYTNGDLHTKNANWAYEGTSQFQVSSNVVYNSGGQNPGLAYRSDVTWPSDQYSEVTAVVTGSANTQFFGPAVRINTSAATGYAVQYGNDAFRLVRYVNGSSVNLGSNATPPITGDVIRLQVVGSILTVFKNGVAVSGMTNIADTNIRSGSAGIHGVGLATLNGCSAWDGGSIASITNFTAQIGGFLSDSTAGAYAAGLGAPAYALEYQSVVSWPNDQYSRVMLSSSSATTSLAGPAIRVSNSATTFYGITPNNSGQLALHKVVNDAAAIILSSVGYTFVQGDVIELTSQGTLLLGKVNGVVKIIVLDSTIAGGAAGFFAENVIGNPSTPAGTFKNWSGGSVSTQLAYSVPDCRTTTATTPNNSRNVQGTLVYDVQKAESRTSGAPVDSRTQGAPVDSRAAGLAPQNSRTPGTIGPGE